MQIPSLLALGLIAAALQPVAQAPPATPPITAPATPQRVVLVELFTSEGCSSCPPADALLRAIDGHTLRGGAQTGTLVVALSEHVTYWNQLGWRDPFSDDSITARQNAYSQRFGLDEVYTPQMIVNGEAQLVGSNRDELVRALTSAHPAAAISLQLAPITLRDHGLDTTVTLSAAAPARGATLYAAIAEDETTEHVLRGENAGRRLEHTAVARSLLPLGTLQSPGTQHLHLPLPATDQGTRRRLIVWAQEPHLGRVLGVATQSF
jgi:hypothetical protein